MDTQTFKPMRDQTFVDQATRFVDIHRPDGKPDLLQQIEHGVLQVAAHYRAYGRLARGMTDSVLYRYHHLGDASTQTDNLLYDPSLKSYQVEGNRSGTPDDRWVFTIRMPSNNYAGIGALSAASRALEGLQRSAGGRVPRDGEEGVCRGAEDGGRTTRRPAWTPGSGWRRDGGPLQLIKATGKQQHIDRFAELLWPSLEQPGGRSLLLAVRALPYLGPGAEKLRPFVEKHRAEAEDLLKQNPYGVPIATGGWAGSGGVMAWATTNYHLHKAYPDLIDKEMKIPRPMYFLFGDPPRHQHLAGGGGRDQVEAARTGTTVPTSRSSPASSCRAHPEARLSGTDGRLAVPLGRERGHHWRRVTIPSSRTR